MQREIALTDHPIDLRRPLPLALSGSAGAVAEFRGLVRADESGARIGALEYEAYSPMAERAMHRLCDEIPSAHDCLFVRITHRIGVVPVGEAAIHIIVVSRHRAASFAFLAAFMDRLKQDVPIWKVRALDPTGQPVPTNL